MIRALLLAAAVALPAQAVVIPPRPVIIPPRPVIVRPAPAPAARPAPAKPPVHSYTRPVTAARRLHSAVAPAPFVWPGAWLWLPVLLTGHHAHCRPVEPPMRPQSNECAEATP